MHRIVRNRASDQSAMSYAACELATATSLGELQLFASVDHEGSSTTFVRLRDPTCL